MGGIEWIVEAFGCSQNALRDLDTVRGFFDRLIRDMKLQPVGQTQWHQFPGAGGITGLCLLAESHLACHTFPEYGSMCLNLFCCVPRAEWDFEAGLKTMFDADSVVVHRLERTYRVPREQVAGV
ncbi:MAG: S-adenosylmethionine decarboxylase [Candidatus Acidiferrales bacterium]